MNTLTEKQLLETYGEHRLVAFIVDETTHFREDIQRAALGIHNCYITYLGEFLKYSNPDSLSAGYLMTRPYEDNDDDDDDDDEEIEGSRRWVENELEETWRELESANFINVYKEDTFFVLADHWQLDLQYIRHVFAELQREYEYVGWMKPSRKGNWYDGWDKNERWERIFDKFLVMITCDGDFTCNGTIADRFRYTSDGWKYSFDSGGKEFKRYEYPDGVRSSQWVEVGN
jgi:hypothetical protein